MGATGRNHRGYAVRDIHDECNEHDDESHADYTKREDKEGKGSQEYPAGEKGDAERKGSGLDDDGERKGKRRSLTR